jgi:hypothetical protein
MNLTVGLMGFLVELTHFNLRIDFRPLILHFVIFVILAVQDLIIVA